MEFTSQNTLQFPAAYAPITEEEMTYIEGGASITPQQFVYNLITNSIRLLGQAAFAAVINGFTQARADGLTTGGAIKHYWNNQNAFGKSMTFVFAGFAGYAVYVYAIQLVNTALNMYKDMKDNYFSDSTQQQDTSSAAAADPTAAATAALTAA